ncbi:excisionase family DNA binding protein [Melghiribacillus thermohalophilus]|uniref:Excisionase family DNA binding protein n=1 Tax=Melghiribacillus thermohalophilus TaxID=1324956 RepID=A0A4R3ND61_9BACI|nr:helix-turn-helix domain-containing protein [Melghiribacillus thermohalophilus]TCT25089.1 excisionase family DNA binding protein [Melghiribacillus thermohalophilus]
MYSISEVARLLHIKQERVRKWCEEGRFEGAVQIGGEWKIPAFYFDFETDDGDVPNSRNSFNAKNQYFSH